MTEIKHHLLIIPGLGDNNPALTWQASRFREFFTDVEICEAPWEKGEENFETKFKRFLQKIDSIPKDALVSVLGVSAGGSFALNAFAKRSDQIHKVVTVCSKLRPARSITSPFDYIKYNQSYIDSFSKFGELESTLTAAERARILTFRPILLDEQVPVSSTYLKGATNITVPIPFHGPAISTALVFYRDRIVEFLIN